MKSLKLFSVAVLATVVAIAAPAFVRANTLGPFATTTPIPSTSTDWTSTLSFPQFNSALGTLNSVTLDFSGSFSTIVTVMNTAGTLGSTGNAKTEVQFSVQDSGSNLTAPQLDLLSPSFTYSLSPSSSASSGLLTKSGDTGPLLFTIPAVLSEFTGAGSLLLSASTYPLTQTNLANTGGNTNATQVTQAALTGTVTYNYTPAPEPSTLALLGVGAVGLLGLRRRRAAKT